MSSHQKPPHRRISLKTIAAPAIGAVVSAPPVLNASDHTIDYSCERCGTAIKRESFMNRSSYFCPKCQRLPR